ncbi:MAG: CBS domain-containing protein [Deltaproteobacteria bacterium]
MLVKEVMTPEVQFIRSDDTIKQAATRMGQLSIGAIPVIAGDEAVGMLTDRDIVLRSVAQGLDPEKHKVMEVFSKGIKSCNEENDLKTAAGLMQDQQIRRLLVKNNEGKVTGIVSLGDLALNVEHHMSGKVLRKVSEPSVPASA